MNRRWADEFEREQVAAPGVVIAGARAPQRLAGTPTQTQQLQDAPAAPQPLAQAMYEAAGDTPETRVAALHQQRDAAKRWYDLLTEALRYAEEAR